MRRRLLIGSTPQHLAVEVVIGLREEAGADASVGSNANPAAMAAEWPRDRRDDADLAYAVGEGEALCRLAGRAGGKFHQPRGNAAGGTPGVQARKNLVHRHDRLRLPGDRKS